jgi:hypothetical protein
MGTRHKPSPAEAPAVTRLPGCNPRIKTEEPGVAASMLTPSATGRLANPLTALSTSFGAFFSTARSPRDLENDDEIAEVASTFAAALTTGAGALKN